MKTKTRNFLGALAMVFLGWGSVASAQDASLRNGVILQGTSVPITIGADDANIALLIRAVNSGYSFDVGTTTARNISFYTDAAATHATLDTTVKCPTGGTAGKIDMSDASCDTLGEIADIINASANWRTVILDGVRSIDVDPGTSQGLLTLTYTDAKDVNGISVVYDTTVQLQSWKAVTPYRTMVPYLDAGFKLKNPHVGTRTAIFKIRQQSAFTTTPNLEVQGVLCTANAGATLGPCSATTVSVYWHENTAATGTDKSFDFTQGFALLGGKNEKLVVRVSGASVFATELMNGYAIQYNYAPSIF